nr:ulp1 protease family, C-terminal catalytic domain-containing protein [Tanacetum cinerariifolium]
MQERDELLKTIKEQKQMILEQQLRLNSVEEKLKPGPSDVDHLDKDDVNINSVVKDEVVKDDVNVDSLAKDDVHVNSLVKEDIKKGDVHDVTRSPTTPKRTVSVPEKVNALFRDKNRMEMRWTFPWCTDGHLVYINFWAQLVGRSHTKRGWLSTSSAGAILKEAGYLLLEPNAYWEMASPYLCDMLSRYQFPLYYADGVKYGVPWFANNVQKVYFSINEKDSHWLLGELHISPGLITIYDSLGCPSNGIETRLFWLDFRDKLQFHIPLFLENVE